MFIYPCQLSIGICIHIHLDQLSSRFSSFLLRWALNPGSADTDGLMSQDWQHYDERKMKLLDSVQPNPSAFTYNGQTNTVCIKHGEAPRPECRYAPETVVQYQNKATQDNSFLRGALMNGFGRFRGGNGRE